jgi:hypothetical protein
MSNASAARKAPSFWSGVARVFDLSLGQMLWSRRTIFMALVLAAPIVFALVVRVIEASGGPMLLKRDFGDIVWRLYIRFVVPVLGVFYGTSLISDEVDDKTLTYLFTRPVPRRAVFLGKYLACVVCTSLLVLPSLTVVFFLIVPLADIGPSFFVLVADIGLLALGLAVYSALFGLVGTVLKRSLVAGLVVAFGWEQIAMLLPGYVRWLTVVYYLQGLAPHVVPTEEGLSVFATVTSDTPGTLVCLLCLFVALAGSLGLGMLVVERREYVLGQ